jgi:8-amino-7-oxononanoate synthase
MPPPIARCSTDSVSPPPDTAASPTAAGVLAVLAQSLAERRAGSRWRVRRALEGPQGPLVTVDGRAVLSFASNDYLGLAHDEAVVAAAHDGLDRFGAGAGASHLLGGHATAHDALEAALARFVDPCDGARALTFSSGYLANLAIVTALCGRHDAVFGDRLDHACLNDGALLSRADFVRYPHADVDALAARLAASRAPRKLIVTDGVFSMDGDVAPLRALLALAERHDALLVVDDAHGFGVLGNGRGSVADAGLRSPRLVVMGTLGKAAGVAGAFVCAHPSVIETLVQSARSYVYTTAAPAALAVALVAALDAIRTRTTLRAALEARIAQFRAGAQALPWRLLPSRTAIQPLVVGDDAQAMALSAALWERGLWAPAIRPPTVPAGTARLRVSLSAGHTSAHVDTLLAALRDEAARR